MLNIQRGNVTVMVTNMDTAVKFYTETLGLNLKNRFEDFWADIEGPGINIGLHPSSKNIKTGDNLSIGFKVNDIDESIQALERKGVKLKIQNDGKLRLALFSDPDSNALYLVQS